MSDFLLLVAGGCIAIYGAAWFLRGLVWAYSRIASRELRQHRVRYTTITVATLILFLLGIFAQGTPGSSDDAQPWILLLSGVLVFAGSVGHSYWMWRKAQQTPPTEEPPEQKSSFRLDDEGPEAGCLTEAIMAVGFAVILAVAASGVEPEAIIALMLAPFFWLGEGLVAAVTNPGYWTGLVVGVGTGWILRGATTN